MISQFISYNLYFDCAYIKKKIYNIRTKTRMNFEVRRCHGGLRTVIIKLRVAHLVLSMIVQVQYPDDLALNRVSE